MAEVEVKECAAKLVGYLRMKGPYEQMPDAFGRVYEWLVARGLTPTTLPETLYLTDPSRVSEEQAEWEVRFWLKDMPAEPAEPDADGIGIKTVAPQTYATQVFKGRYEGLESAYAGLMTWIRANGYHVVGLPVEVYLNGPGDVSDPDEYLTEVRLPVARM